MSILINGRIAPWMMTGMQPAAVACTSRMPHPSLHIRHERKSQRHARSSGLKAGQ